MNRPFCQRCINVKIAEKKKENYGGAMTHKKAIQSVLDSLENLRHNTAGR